MISCKLNVNQVSNPVHKHLQIKAPLRKYTTFGILEALKIEQLAISAELDEYSSVMVMKRIRKYSWKKYGSQYTTFFGVTGNISPFFTTPGMILSWKDWITEINFAGHPKMNRSLQNPSSFTESKALVKSTNEDHIKTTVWLTALFLKLVGSEDHIYSVQSRSKSTVRLREDDFHKTGVYSIWPMQEFSQQQTVGKCHREQIVIINPPYV